MHGRPIHCRSAPPRNMHASQQYSQYLQEVHYCRKAHKNDRQEGRIRAGRTLNHSTFLIGRITKTGHFLAHASENRKTYFTTTVCTSPSPVVSYQSPIFNTGISAHMHQESVHAFRSEKLKTRTMRNVANSKTLRCSIAWQFLRAKVWFSPSLRSAQR